MKTSSDDRLQNASAKNKMRWKKLANFGKHPSSSKRRAKSQNNSDIKMIDSPSSSILVVRVIDCGGVKKAAHQSNDFLFETIVKTSFIIKKKHAKCPCKPYIKKIDSPS